MTTMINSVIPCPDGTKDKCNFIKVTGIELPDEDDAFDLIKKSFPLMSIHPAWKRKIFTGKTLVLRENGEKLIGIINTADAPDNGASVSLLAVGKDYRDKGLGSFLLGKAEEMAIKSGKRFVKLMTEQVKRENIIFYSKKGYHVTGFDEHGYEHSPAVLFEKKLDQR
jgi:ribosomal protein S18 acetylase RimI-like enzyme